MPLLSAILLLIASPTSPEIQGSALSDPKLDVKVSVELNATGAKTALLRLSESTGVSLEVSNQMLGPVLAIRTKDIPLRDVMARIAQVTTGEWQKSNDKFILYADGAKQRREALEEQAQRLQEIRQGVQSLVKQNNPQPNKGGQANEDVEVQAQTMSFGMLGGSANVGKAISRILPNIDLSLLATMEAGDRIVFSTAPTFVQRPLPNNLGPVFAELIAEHNKSAAARANEEKEAESAEEKQLREFYESLFGGDKSDKPITERPAKALLVASRESMGFGLNVELRLYGEGGKVVLSGTTTLPISGGGLMADAMEFAIDKVGAQSGQPSQEPKKPVVPGEDKPIQLSPETIELRKAFGGLASGGPDTERKIPDSILEKFAHPDVVEPLSIGIGEAILAAAKAKGLNLVANLPDDLMSMFDMMQEGPTTANGVLGELMEGETKAEIKDGWVTSWPANPEKARRERQDRVALARLISAARAKGAATLDDIAAYAMVSRPPMDTPVAMVYVMFFASNAMQNGMLGMLDWNMLRLYGTLGLTQRQSLANGNSLTFGQFIPTQKTHLTKLSFGAEARLEVEGQSNKKQLPGILAIASSFLPHQTGDFREEPTEAMPSGLPNGGMVTATISDDIVGKPVGGGALGQMIAVLGADELAMFEWMKSDPMFAQAGEMMPKLDGLRLGTRKTYTFKFTVAPGVTFTKVLNDDFVDKNAPVTKMDSLPEALKAKIAAKVAEFKKNPLPFGLGGREVIPPK